MKPSLLWLLGGAFLYYATAQLGIYILSSQPSNIALLWLPSGIGLIMCLRAGARAFPFILLASVATNAPGMMATESVAHAGSTLAAGLIDTFSAYLARYMLLRSNSEQRFRNVNGLFIFAIWVCVVPAAICALLLSTNLLLGGYINLVQFSKLIFQLTAADSLGVLLVYPLYQMWRSQLITRALFTWTALYFSTMVLALIGLSFLAIPGLIYLTPPLLAYLAYQKNTSLLMPLIPLVVISIFICAHFDLGPFDLPDRDDGLVALAIFSFLLTLAPLSILLHSRELKTVEEARDMWMGFAQKDQLSGLPNRYGFGVQVNQVYETAKRYKRPMVVAMIDIDHFKKVNDSYGHLVGDKVIRELADLIRASIRKMDLPCRYGGEEFAIVFPETTIAQAVPVLERLRTDCEVHQTKLGDKVSFGITVSLGAVEYNGEDISIEQLFAEADKLLYNAKSQGRNRLVINP